MQIYNHKGEIYMLKKVKETYPEKDVWCFTGYLFDRDLLGRMAEAVPETKELLSYIDVLVDGEFVLEKKDVTLLFKGSSNQRTINVPESLRTGDIIFWDPGHVSMSKMAKV